MSSERIRTTSRDATTKRKTAWLSALPGAPSAPIPEPSLAQPNLKRHERVSAAIPLSSRQRPIIDQLTVLIHPNRVELVINGIRKGLPTETRTTPEQPNRSLKAVAEELSKPGFRISFYTIHVRRRDCIKVEIRSGRTKGKHTWKKAKVCDTANEAIAYIKEAHRAFLKNGGR